MKNYLSKFTKGKKRIFVFIFVAFLAIFISGWYILGKWAQKHGFDGAGDFVKTVSANYWSSFDAKYETIEITIDQNDFDKLSDQRDFHMKNKMITKIEDRFVPAIITYNGKKIKSKIRLKGHMTDHLQEKKWSFRVKTVKGDAFKGMKVFSLMHPGTRNYIYEWIYHQLLTQENIATVRYSFINVKVNGESWGIYAVEEHFAEELVSHSKLPKGPILGFNPDLYWYARIQEHQRTPINQEAIGFVSTYPEAYDEEEQFKDEESKMNYASALVKFRKFLAKEATASQTFDIKKLARFHAILDLVGGQFSLDWSDVKYYYNPVTQLLEPVGYESFSVRETRQLCGSFKFKNDFNLQNSWHEMLFSDPDFYASYLIELNRISQTDYLDRFFNKIDSDLRNNLNVIYTEFPYKKLSLKGYYKNQDYIKRLIQAPATAAVYLEKAESDTLFFSVTTTSQFPYQINQLISAGKRIKLNTPVLLSARKTNEPVFYESFNIPCVIDSTFDMNKLELEFNLPGGKNNKVYKIKVKNTNPETTEDFVKLRSHEKSNIDLFSFLEISETNKTILIKPGKHQITQSIYIPANFKVVAKAPLELDFVNHSEIVSKSPILFSGNDNEPILLISSDSTGVSIFMNDTKEISKFKYVEIVESGKSGTDKNLNSSITIYESNCDFSNIRFSGFQDNFLYAVRSNVTVKNSFFMGANKGISSQFSTINLNRVEFSNKKNAIRSVGSKITVSDITIYNTKSGIVVKSGSVMNGSNVKISSSKEGIVAEDLSKVTITNLSLEKLDVGLIAEKKSNVFGPATINIKKMNLKEVKSNFEKDKKSEINIKW